MRVAGQTQGLGHDEYYRMAIWSHSFPYALNKCVYLSLRRSNASWTLAEPQRTAIIQARRRSRHAETVHRVVCHWWWSYCIQYADLGAFLNTNNAGLATLGVLFLWHSLYCMAKCWLRCLIVHPGIAYRSRGDRRATGRGVTLPRFPRTPLCHHTTTPRAAWMTTWR